MIVLPPEGRFTLGFSLSGGALVLVVVVALVGLTTARPSAPHELGTRCVPEPETVRGGAA
ncbi:hypothetical protein [Actinoallomurus sp. NPDC052274]|uniref:hypothetical protein n=1 Tax=Actinoallomurus sp. NPDC052274 TaxID=3155420 RepID=UPI0034177ECD